MLLLLECVNVLLKAVEDEHLPWKQGSFNVSTWTLAGNSEILVTNIKIWHWDKRQDIICQSIEKLRKMLHSVVSHRLFIQNWKPILSKGLCPRNWCVPTDEQRKAVYHENGYVDCVYISTGLQHQNLGHNYQNLALKQTVGHHFPSYWKIKEDVTLSSKPLAFYSKLEAHIIRRSVPQKLVCMSWFSLLMLLLLECVNVLLKAVEDEQRKAVYHESRVHLMCLL